MEIIKTDGIDERFVMLCRKLDEFLSGFSAAVKIKGPTDI